MIADRNLDLGFTAYDSIHGDQNQYPKQIASFFYQNHSIIFKDHYMNIYSVQRALYMQLLIIPNLTNSNHV